MLRSVEGYWLSAQVFTGEFTNSYFHFFPEPGATVYATISLSEVKQYPMDREPVRDAAGYISRWAVYGPDGRLVGPNADSMGRSQNAVMIRDCGFIQFDLHVANWTVATAQINIFQLEG